MIFIFILLLLASPILFIIGMIKPEKVIYWGKRTRKMVAIYSVALFIISFIMIGILADPMEEAASDSELAAEESEAKPEDEEEKEPVNNTPNEKEESSDESIKEDIETEKQENEEKSIADTENEKVEEQKSNAELANPPPPSGQLKVHYIDVGQGDATLLQGPDFNILIDAGRHNGNEVVPYLKAAGVQRLDLLVGTHPHADHIGQIDKVIQNFDVKEVWMSGDETTSRTFERVIDAILSSNAKYHEPRAGERFNIGSLRVEVINPDRLTGDLHEGSISMRTIYGDIAFVFTSDAERQTEQAMINRGHNLQAQIFQMGHHGSRTSNIKAFLDKMKPEVAIYSAGANNQYGHPHDEVINRIKGMGITIYGTDVHGHIIVTTDGKTYDISTKKSGTISGNSNSNTSSGSSASSSSNSSSSGNTSSSSSTKKEEPKPEEPKQSASVGEGCGPNQVNINTASLDEIKRIRHIDDVRGKELIQLRPFKSVDDLVRINGIAAGRLGDIKAEGIACAN